MIFFLTACIGFVMGLFIFCQHPPGPEQLFGLHSDPREEHDLAADPAQARRLAEMRERFAELKAEAR